MSKHWIVYESGHQAVCACGEVLSIFGRITTIAAELGQHIRQAPIVVPRDPHYPER